jgi:predicted chitinase
MAEGDLVTQPDIIEDNKDANAIASMLWIWKWVNRNSVSAGTISDNPITIKLADGTTDTPIGSFLKPSGDVIEVTTNKYEIYYIAYEDGWFSDGPTFNINKFPDIFSSTAYKTESRSFETSAQLNEYLIKLNEGLKQSGKNKKTHKYYRDRIQGQTGEVYQEEITVEYVVQATAKKLANSQKTTSTESPIKSFEYYDAFWIKTEPVQYYFRFGALLEFIANSILPKVNNSNDDYSSKPPIFEIDYNTYYNYMYSLPNQISLDPRVCLVRNDAFTKESGTAEVLKQLQLFRAVDGGGTTNSNFAYPMNIYLNFEFIIESLNSNADERGDVNVYDFLKSICDGLNKALGGINNLEPVIDETSNTLSILDTTPIPGFGQRGADYTLQLYGYEKAGTSYNSTFVRKVDLKTAITPEYATMVTVGATAGGYVKGTEATAFSRWNIGLTDRFKEEFVPGNENSAPDNGVDEASINYVEKFLSSEKFTSCYGFSGDLKNPTTLKLSTDAIENNLSVVSEYYKYLVASKGTSSGGTIGFVPFKISFTMDGISGIKIYNKLHVDTRFLPKAYGDNLNLIVTGVSHKLSNSDWETDIEATVIPKTENGNASIITTNAVREDIKETVLYAPLGPVPPTNWEIDHETFARYKKSTTRGKNIDQIIDTFKIAGVTNPYAMVALLCTMGKESGFENNRENMNYSYKQLINPDKSPWQNYFAKSEERKTLAYNLTKGTYYGNKGGAETFANFIYGYDGSNPPGKRTKQNSAGNLTWGDGWKYRGGGYNGITFKAIYEDYGKRIGIDLVKYPEKISEPRVAAQVAVEYYKKTISIKKLNSVTSINQAIDLCIRATAGRGADSVTIARNTEKAYKQLPGFKIIYKK